MSDKTPKTCEDIISCNLETFIDVCQENGECKDILQTIANNNKTAVLAFIAPFVPVRVSPNESQGAVISLSEEFAMLSAIEKIKAANIDKLYLLVHTPGGYVPSSYKIANY